LFEVQFQIYCGWFYNFQLPHTRFTILISGENMSDEKIDRIDERIAELLIISGNLAVEARDMVEKSRIHCRQFNGLDGKVDKLDEQQVDVVGTLINLEKWLKNLEQRQFALEKSQKELKQEMKEGFERIAVASEQRIENLEPRVDIIGYWK
jgi:hypothetical protein